MSDCWRCGKPAETGSECDKCITEQYGLVAGQQMPPSSLIDWDKVHSLDDMKEIFEALGFRVFDNSPAYEKLRRFFKD